MFGDEHTDFGRTMQMRVQDYYAYSIDTDLIAVMRTMTEYVTNLGLESSFYKDYEGYERPESYLINYTEIDINKYAVGETLEEFTAATNIPIVIAVDYMENVFEKRGIDTFSIIAMIIIAAVMIMIIVSMVKSNRRSKASKGASNKNSEGESDGESRRDPNAGKNRDYDKSRYNRKL